MEKYPQKLIDFLREQESENNEVFTTHTKDGVVFIIPQKSLDKCIIYIEWCGADDYSVVNINSDSFNRLFKVMREIKPLWN